jgi:hypothetical protein
MAQASAESVVPMLKTLLLVLAGLCAGLAIAFWLQPSPTQPVAAAAGANGMPSAERRALDDGAASAERLAALEGALAAEAERRAALEARVAELNAAIEELGERPRRRSDAANGAPEAAAVERARARFERDADVSPEERDRRAIERLVSAGFAPDRAAWIHRRTQELRFETMQSQYEARREGRPPPPDLETTALRAELGDQDYERFLSAMGRSTSVNVMGVLASSPAERAGLEPGDEIVAYDGKRIFDIAELNELTLGGTSGESVVVDVRRNGQNLQLVLPRGPIGVWGGFRGSPVPIER